MLTVLNITSLFVFKYNKKMKEIYVTAGDLYSEDKIILPVDQERVSRLAPVRSVT